MATAIMALVIAMMGGATAQPRSNDDYCRPGGAARLVLIDVTTPYDAADRHTIEAMLRDVLRAMQGGDRIIVRTITDSHTRSDRLIVRCAPHCEAEGFYARLLNCSDGVIRADRDAVHQDIMAALRSRLSQFTALKSSDILRTIATAAREDHSKPASLHLYLYSDLLENSELMSRRTLFAGSPGRTLDELRRLRLIPALTDADVRVAGVGRSDAPDRKPLSVRELNALRDFWTGYFRAAGARQISIELGATPHQAGRERDARN